MSSNGVRFPLETKVFFDDYLKDPPEFHFHWNPILENGWITCPKKQKAPFIKNITNIKSTDFKSAL
ncbi:hypothetical protein [Thermococcus piezophilus]|uniref:hypothetical protein n=1 Tax=Thermococcus piezophilus TaxID=1712654 RepID=UPI00190170E5|nr:hypothetical protein [Thermococcus piezophilus]